MNFCTNTKKAVIPIWPQEPQKYISLKFNDRALSPTRWCYQSQVRGGVIFKQLYFLQREEGTSF